jgi:chromosome partitioning protein
MMIQLMPALSRVLTVANGKGGAGKTSTACNMAGLAAAGGWRILFIEMDPQGNAGRDFGYKADGSGDDGAELLRALQEGDALRPVLENYRYGLDVIPGGKKLEDLEDILIGRARRSADADYVLARALIPIAHEYDLIIIDTPPTRPYLLSLALTATRWVLIPTRADAASVDGLETLAERLVHARGLNPDIEVLGAILFDVETTATSIRREAAADISAALGNVAPLFSTVIRHSTASAKSARDRGLLVHELAATVDNAAPFYEALRSGRRPERLPGSAPALADDYVLLVQEILTTIAAKESEEESGDADGVVGGAEDDAAIESKVVVAQ